LRFDEEKAIQMIRYYACGWKVSKVLLEVKGSGILPEQNGVLSSGVCDISRLSGNKCGPQWNVRYKYVEDNIQIAAEGFPGSLTEEEKS